MHKVRVFVCLLLIVFLFACGDPQPAEETPAAPTDAPEDEPVTVVVTETPQPVPAIELYGQKFRSDLGVLELSSPVTDFAPLFDALPSFPNCRSVQLTRNFDPADTEGGLSVFEQAWAERTAAYPDVAFSGDLLIGGVPAETLESYVVPASAALAEEVRTVVSLCPALKTLDLTETEASRENVASAEQDAPHIRFLWTDAVYGASDSDAAALSFSGAQDPDALCAYLACFPALSELDLSETTLSDEQLNAVSDRFSNVTVRRTVLLNGAAFDSYTETLDFSDAKIASYEAFSDAIGRFPKLKTLELHDCSLSNEQMAAIRDRYPDVKVVWTIHLKAKALRWTVRTDAVAFSTQQSGNSESRLQTKDVEALRYCRDLIALDLGHNNITDIGWIADLQNLQVLILADNRKIRDISAIGTLTKLKYLELFLDLKLEDISPLSNCTELLDVNLILTHTADLTPLLSCKKLERIWIGKDLADEIGKEGIGVITDAFPNAEFDLVSLGSTKLGWREHPRFYALRQMFKENIAVEPFLP